MKVICAGFSKTGTKTMAHCLRILGLNVYDYAEHYLEHGAQWKEILEPSNKRHPDRRKLVEMFQEMYKEVDAVTDIPACYFWEEILEAFPEAKVILVLRDEKQWFESVVNFSKEIELRTPRLQFFMRFLASKTTRDHFFYAQRVFKETLGVFPNSKNLCEVLTVNRYRLHNSKVLQRCPSTSLLIHRLKNGWAPLCQFLKVSIPTNADGTVYSFPEQNVSTEGIEKWKNGQYSLSSVMFKEIEEFKRKFYVYTLLCLMITFLFNLNSFFST